MKQKNHRYISLLYFWKCCLLICLPLWTLPTFFKIKKLLENKKNVLKKRDQNLKKTFFTSMLAANLGEVRGAKWERGKRERDEKDVRPRDWEMVSDQVWWKIDAHACSRRSNNELAYGCIAFCVIRKTPDTNVVLFSWDNQYENPSHEFSLWISQFRLHFPQTGLSLVCRNWPAFLVSATAFSFFV